MHRNRMAWCIAKRSGGLWQACEFGSDLWKTAAWRWQVSTRRSVAEQKALDLNRQERARLAKLADSGTVADIHSTPDTPVGSPRERFDRTGIGCTEHSSMGPDPYTLPRRPFQSMQLDARTHLLVTKAAERLSERRGHEVSRVQVVRWALRAYALEQGLADLLSEEAAR